MEAAAALIVGIVAGVGFLAFQRPLAWMRLVSSFPRIILVNRMVLVLGLGVAIGVIVTKRLPERSIELMVWLMVMPNVVVGLMALTLLLGWLAQDYWKD